MPTYDGAYIDPRLDPTGAFSAANPLSAPAIGTGLLQFLSVLDRAQRGDIQAPLAYIGQGLEAQNLRRLQGASTLGYEQRGVPSQVTEERGPIGAFFQNIGMIGEPKPRALSQDEIQAAEGGATLQRVRSMTALQNYLGFLHSLSQYDEGTQKKILSGFGLEEMGAVTPRVSPITPYQERELGLSERRTAAAERAASATQESSILSKQLSIAKYNYFMSDAILNPKGSGKRSPAQMFLEAQGKAVVEEIGSLRSLREKVVDVHPEEATKIDDRIEALEARREGLARLAASHAGLEVTDPELAEALGLGLTGKEGKKSRAAGLFSGRQPMKRFTEETERSLTEPTTEIPLEGYSSGGLVLPSRQRAIRTPPRSMQLTVPSPYPSFNY